MNSLKIISLLLFLSFGFESLGQVKLVKLDEITFFSRNDDYKALSDFSKYIAYDESFDYREELRLSKSQKIVYHFGEKTVSKVQLLKTFRKASSKSESANEFNQYFLYHGLGYIHSIDNETLTAIYHTMRPLTLNGYFDKLKEMDYWF